MPEVSVNINGRDNGLGAQLDALREKAIRTGNDISRLNSLSSQTNTEQKQSLSGVTESYTNSRIQQVKKQFDDLRATMKADFQRNLESIQGREGMSDEMRASAVRGLKRRSERRIEGVNEDEEREIKAIEEDSNKTLKEILKTLGDNQKIDRERKQRGREEIKSQTEKGYLGGLMKEKEELNKLKMSAPTADLAKEFQAKLRANQAKIDEVNEEGKGGGNKGDQLVSMLSGGGSGIATRLLGALGMSTIVAGAAVGAAGLVAKAGFDAQEDANKLNALRVTGEGGLQGRRNILRDYTQTGYAGNGMNISALGVKNDEFMNASLNTAQISGTSNRLREKTYENLAFNKAYGVDISGNTQFDRMYKTQTTTAENTLNMMNILSSIDKSSLKTNDLSSLKEKITIQTALITSELTKRNKVDGDALNRLYGAFESVGLSDKGSRGADFLQNYQQSLVSTGTSNVDLVKYQAVRDAFPDADASRVRRIAMGGGTLEDQLKYGEKLKSNLLKMSQGRNKSSTDLLTDINFGAVFNGMNFPDLDMVINSTNSKAFGNVMNGKAQINKNFTKANMMSNAKDNVSGAEEWGSAMKNGFSNFSATIVQGIGDAINGSTKQITDTLTNGKAVVKTKNDNIMTNQPIKPKN